MSQTDAVATPPSEPCARRDRAPDAAPREATAFADIPGVAAFAYDRRADILRLDTQGRRWFGLETPEAPRAAWLGRIAPADRAKVAEALEGRDAEICVMFRIDGEAARHLELRGRWRGDEAAGVWLDVSAHRRAIEKLEMAEEMLRLGQKAGRIATFRRDLQRNTVICDAQSRELMGFDAEEGEMSPLQWQRVMPPEDRERVAKTMADAVARKASEIAYSFRVRRPGETSLRTFEMRAYYFYDALGRPDRSIGVAIDVTETVRVAERLAISEEVNRIGQKTAGVAVFARDLQTDLVEFPPQAREILGLPPEGPVTTGDWLGLILPEERDAVGEAMRAAVAGRRPNIVLNYRIRRPTDGQVRVMESRGEYHYDETGRPLRALGAVIDVTESVEAAERLRLSEEINRLAQKVARVAVTLRDPVLQITHFSREAREMLGLPQDREITDEYWLSIVVDEDRDALVAALRGAAERRQSETTVEYRIARPSDGEIRTLESRAQFVFDAEGRPIRMLGALIDVTENRRAADKLRMSEELRRLGQQAAGIIMYSRDLDTGAVVVTPESLPLMGLRSDQAPTTPADMAALIVPEDRARVARELDEATERRGDVALEFRIRRPSDGEIRYLEVRANYQDERAGPRRRIMVGIDVTRRKLAEEKLRYAARHDALTGLPNRTLLREHVEETLARMQSEAPFAVMCLDLDRFKEVNDTLGHAAGDHLLIEASRRLRAHLREGDMLARLGGDEFAVLAGGLADADAAAALAGALVESLSPPFFLEGERVEIGVSVGVAFGPRDGARHDDLMRAADMALYEAKGAGRGRFALFVPQMRAKLQSRRALRLDLERALERSEFEVFYQPILEVRTRRLSGFEALVRWRRPDGAYASPADFIPLCEETGLIAPLGAFVTEAACREAARWPGDLSVAVNLSPYQLASATLESDILGALKASGLDPARLELEITESAVLSETQATLATLARLKGLGLRIAMDDFGAGYSSLSYLRRFPFDRVKIDRDFIREIDASPKALAIVRTLADLCDALEMSTTAEGVETEAQLAAASLAGCRRVQGYLFSPPRPARDIAALIAKFGDPALVVAAE